MVLLTNQHDKHMNKLKLVIGIFAMGFFTMTSCNNSENTTTETEVLPDPEQGGDAERYNINAPDAEVINLDSTEVDTTVQDTAQ